MTVEWTRCLMTLVGFLKIPRLDFSWFAINMYDQIRGPESNKAANQGSELVRSYQYLWSEFSTVRPDGIITILIVFGVVKTFAVDLLLGKIFVDRCIWGVFPWNWKAIPLCSRASAELSYSSCHEVDSNILSKILRTEEKGWTNIIRVAKSMTIIEKTESSVMLTTY